MQLLCQLLHRQCSGAYAVEAQALPLLNDHAAGLPACLVWAAEGCVVVCLALQVQPVALASAGCQIGGLKVVQNNNTVCNTSVTGEQPKTRNAGTTVEVACRKCSCMHVCSKAADHDGDTQMDMPALAVGCEGATRDFHA